MVFPRECTHSAIIAAAFWYVVRASSIISRDRRPVLSSNGNNIVKSEAKTHAELLSGLRVEVQSHVQEEVLINATTEAILDGVHDIEFTNHDEKVEAIRSLLQLLMDGEERVLTSLINLAKNQAKSDQVHQVSEIPERPLDQVYDQKDTDDCWAHAGATVLHQRLIDMYPGLRLRDLLPWCENDRDIHHFLVSLATRHNKNGGHFWLFVYLVGPVIGALAVMFGKTPEHRDIGISFIDHQLLRLGRYVEDTTSHRNLAFINDADFRIAKKPYYYEEAFGTVVTGVNHSPKKEGAHAMVLQQPVAEGDQSTWILLDSRGTLSDFPVEDLTSWPHVAHLLSENGTRQIVHFGESLQYEGIDGNTYGLEWRQLKGLADPVDINTCAVRQGIVYKIFSTIFAHTMQSKSKQQLRRIFPDGLNIELLGVTTLQVSADWGMSDIMDMILQDLNERQENIADALNKCSGEASCGYMYSAPTLMYTLNRKELDIGIFQKMIDHGADIEIKNGYGRSFFNQCINLGKMDIAKFLRQIGADIDSIDNFGWSALHASILGGYLDAFEWLVAEGADIHSQDKLEGFTPLDLVFNALEDRSTDAASSTKYLEMAKYLLQHDGTANKYLDPVRSYGLLVRLIELGKGEIAERVLDGCVDLNHVFPPDDEYLLSATFLHRACLDNHFELAVMVLDRRPEMINSSRPESEFTPLHFALNNASVSNDFLHYLLAKGADIDARSSRGYTPLYWSIKYGRLDRLQFLLENGCDVNAEMPKGSKAVDFALWKWAREDETEDTIEQILLLLMQYGGTSDDHEISLKDGVYHFLQLE